MSAPRAPRCGLRHRGRVGDSYSVNLMSSNEKRLRCSSFTRPPLAVPVVMRLSNVASAIARPQGTCYPHGWRFTHSGGEVIVSARAPHRARRLPAK